MNTEKCLYRNFLLLVLLFTHIRPSEHKGFLYNIIGRIANLVSSNSYTAVIYRKRPGDVVIMETFNGVHANGRYFIKRELDENKKKKEKFLIEIVGNNKFLM